MATAPFRDQGVGDKQADLEPGALQKDMLMLTIYVQARRLVGWFSMVLTGHEWPSKVGRVGRVGFRGPLWLHGLQFRT